MKASVFPLLLSLLTSLHAAEPKETPAWIDPAKVDDPDFAIQGEYSGELAGKKTGAQIWAQGGGKFEVVLYPGGLPGGGYDGDRKSVVRIPGSLDARVGKAVLFEKEGNSFVADGRRLSKFTEVAVKDDALTRIERKSPTLGAKPPQGAVVLFDGKDTTHFPGAKMTADGLLEQGATSSDRLGDGTLHIEFMTAYKPTARGQGRGNSGVYLQSRYEVQVLDSFALEGKNNECGGIYSISAPKMNMCFPPLTWQTYDIDFISAKFDAAGKKTANARMTVRHNGVVVQDNVEIPHITTSAPMKEENTPGPLHLQDHKNPARYRNIWFLPASGN